MSRSGSLMSAMAIMMRCSWPPENSCGYCFRRRSVSLMPTRSSRVLQRARICSAGVFGWCAAMASPSCSPMRMKGLSEVIGSWKIMPMRLPRSWRRVSGGASSMETPSKAILASAPYSVMLSGCRRTMLIAVTDLPEPDSPTSASVSPLFRLKLTPRTACTVSRSRRNLTSRLSMVRRGVLFVVIVLTGLWGQGRRAGRRRRS